MNSTQKRKLKIYPSIKIVQICNMIKKIPYGKQFIDNSDISLVKQSLRGKYITTGNFVNLFEKEIKKKNWEQVCSCMCEWDSWSSLSSSKFESQKR